MPHLDEEYQSSEPIEPIDAVETLELRRESAKKEVILLG